MDKLKVFALKVSNLIIANEQTTGIPIDWESILNSFGFEDIFEKNIEIKRHQSYGNNEYSKVANKILLESIEKNRKTSEEMLNYLLNTSKISNAQYDFLFEDKFNFIKDNRLKEINNTVFISYSSKDKIDFDIINNALENIGFKSYIAEKNIDLIDEWKQDIIRQLNESDIVIAILSKNFKKSDYCSQEIGIAIQRESIIIPLTLDETDSYGFFTETHAKNINDEAEIRIPKAIVKKYYTQQMINYLIDRLMDLELCNNYDICNLYLEIMKPVFKKFNDHQVNNLVKAVQYNNQLHGKYGTQYLQEFYELHNSKISQDLINEFEKIIDI